MTDDPHLTDEDSAAMSRLLDGIAPLAQRPETEAFIDGARTAADLLARHDAEAGDQ